MQSHNTHAIQQYARSRSSQTVQHYYSARGFSWSYTKAREAEHKHSQSVELRIRRSHWLYISTEAWGLCICSYNSRLLYLSVHHTTWTRCRLLYRIVYAGCAHSTITWRSAIWLACNYSCRLHKSMMLAWPDPMWGWGRLCLTTIVVYTGGARSGLHTDTRQAMRGKLWVMSVQYIWHLNFPLQLCPPEYCHMYNVFSSGE